MKMKNSEFRRKIGRENYKIGNFRRNSEEEFSFPRKPAPHAGASAPLALDFLSLVSDAGCGLSTRLVAPLKRFIPTIPPIIDCIEGPWCSWIRWCLARSRWHAVPAGYGPRQDVVGCADDPSPSSVLLVGFVSVLPASCHPLVEDCCSAADILISSLGSFFQACFSRVALF
uniref:Uncharacterized protein n=2 Tax=Caenorhabditis japonica TaxID=281687 RepID=A0A8R1I5U0_CAEJA